MKHCLGTHASDHSRAADGRRPSLPSPALASPCYHRGCMPTRSPHLLCPPGLEVPAGHTLFLQGSAIGTQNYICLPTDSGFGWVFFGPQATLFNFRGKSSPIF